MAFTGRAALLTALIGLCPVAALAQVTPPAGTAGPTGPATADTAAPAASGGAAAPVYPGATGYGWSTKPRKHGPWRAHTPVARAQSQTPDALLPGFETLADGSTRLFVLMSKPVQFEAKPAQGTLTYVLKGAHENRRNNYNPLVTVHFNTPVASARLVPHGRDLWFVVDLRAATTPTVAMDAAKDGGAMLRIEFPKGDYLPSMGAPPPPPVTGPAAMPTPAPSSSARFAPSGL